MSNFHFILDYETIGQDVFCIPTVNCSYYTFDWNRFLSNNPYTFNELIKEIKFAKFNIKNQMENDGCRYKKEDLEFWMSNPLAKSQLIPSDNDILPEQFVHQVYEYLENTNINRWWSRSNTFDPILLHRQFMDHWTRDKLNFVLPYWKVRDIRTYIDTRFDFKNRVNNFCPIDDEALWNQYFIPHNSVHDVAADILRLQKIERTLHVE